MSLRPEAQGNALEIAKVIATKSPTALRAVKLGALMSSLPIDEEVRNKLEQRLYELCLSSGDPAAARMNFKGILKGDMVAWAPALI